jgi:23S rRNA (adenine2503-C2)-methyltransferase
MLDCDELIEKFKEKKIPRFRALQIFQAVGQQGAKNYESISTLPRQLKESLSKDFPIFSIQPVRTMVSADKNTEKTLFELHDGLKIEGVLMKFKDGRHSVCISSQAGCQLGCKFCATGTMKFGRNLTYEEIADQVLFFAQRLQTSGEHISNIVYMGMGEPFMNYEQVLQSARVINDKRGLNIGARHITVSTSGIVEGIEQFADEDIQLNLAISLHAPNQELRQKIMPIARKYSLDQLMHAARQYIEKTHRRISYEYVMLKGINDSPKEAEELGRLLKGQLCHVNLIPYNATDIANIEGSPRENIFRFRDIVKDAGLPVTIRVTLGQDIAAACGQLANKANGC